MLAIRRLLRASKLEPEGVPDNQSTCGGTHAMSSPSQYPSVMPDDASTFSKNIPRYKLFDPTSVGLAAFLGSPIAGTALMGINYRRLRRPGAATAAIVTGIAVTGLVIACARWIPQWATFAVGLALFLGTYNSAKVLQAPLVARHEQMGGQTVSRWVATGVGLIALAAWVGVVLFPTGLGSKVLVGTKDNVYYSGLATKQDAKALGDALKADGFFTDRGATVLLSKGNDGTVVSFVVQDGIWEQPDMVAGFEEVGRQVAPSVGGFPIKVRLANTLQQTKKEVTVGRLLVGTKDHVYYLGSATAADATAAANALKAASYFQDHGADVFLAKDERGTTISFVVAQGLWDDPQVVAECQKMVRHSVVPVFGVPITVRLLNSNLETKKAMVISSLTPAG
jgi:hypothetical protein